MSNGDDRVIRTMTDDGSFRVLAARMTDTARCVAATQDVRGTAAVALANTVTASVLVRETMAPTNRVQVLYTDHRSSRLVGDAHPKGNTRGLARVVNTEHGVHVGKGGILQVERIVRAGKAHQGLVETSDHDDLGRALQSYFKQSEQVESMVDLGCVIDADGSVVGAAGYVVQLLPELTDPPLEAMNERHAAFGSLEIDIREHGCDPQRIMATVLAGVDYTQLADSAVQFHCPCDRDRVVGAASTLGKDEIRELLATGEELAINCDYCRQEYRLGPADYRRILES